MTRSSDYHPQLERFKTEAQHKCFFLRRLGEYRGNLGKEPKPHSLETFFILLFTHR